MIVILFCEALPIKYGGNNQKPATDIGAPELLLNRSDNRSLPAME